MREMTIGDSLIEKRDTRPVERGLCVTRTRDTRVRRMYIPTEMQYLFTCVNTSVPGLPAAKFAKYIGPENSRNGRPA